MEGTDVSFKESWTSPASGAKKLTLTPGIYKMVEDSAPEGYEKASDIDFMVTVDLRLLVIKESGTEEAASVIMVNKPVYVEYMIIEGANSTWPHDSKDAKRFKSNAPFAKFTTVEVDGVTVAASDYTVSEGSTIVDFKASYMDTLKIGKHTLKVNATDGSAFTQLSVLSDKPNTGDNNLTVLYLLMMLVSAGIILISSRLIKMRSGKAN